MNILDALIVVLLILGAMAGARRGVIKELVLLLGLVVVLVLSFNLRTPVSTFLYKNLPFFDFHGIFKGVSALNILLYELIAFLVVFVILYLILRVLLKISGIIEKVFRATIILGFFSRIAGAIVGFIEAYIIVFIILFVCSQPFFNITGIKDSKLSNRILEDSFILSDATDDAREVLDEIDNLTRVYKNDSKNFNQKTIEVFTKYEIISDDNIEYLREKGKLD